MTTFPRLRAGIDVSMRVDDLLDRVAAVDDRPELPRLDQRVDVLQGRPLVDREPSHRSSAAAHRSNGLGASIAAEPARTSSEKRSRSFMRGVYHSTLAYEHTPLPSPLLLFGRHSSTDAGGLTTAKTGSVPSFTLSGAFGSARSTSSDSAG